MILVAGIMPDGMIELMCARLEYMVYDYLFLDELRFPGALNVSWSVCRHGVAGYIQGPAGRVSLDDITGVYARYVQHRGPAAEGMSEIEGQFIQAEYQASLISLFDLMPCVVVNRVKASASNDSKLYQQFIASTYGFLTPRTL